jgi:phage/plasmid-like protein (TIGR03299 family)
MTPNIDAAERYKIIAARINEGRDTFAGRLDAWHLLGTVSGKFQSWEEIEKNGGPNYSVIKRQLEFAGKPVGAWGTFRIDAEIPKGLEDRAVKVRSAKTGEERYLSFLSPVGENYTVIDHREGFKMLDHLVGQIDGAHYETVGTLDWGATVWAQVDPNVSIRVGDDVSKILLTYHTSHDGSKPHDIFETGVREVCKNTFRAGSLNRLSDTVRVKHTKNAQKRIDNLVQEIDEIKDVALSMQDKLTYLAGKRVTKESLTTIVDRLFPKVESRDGQEVNQTRRDNILASVMSLFESNDGNAFPEQRGTAYSLWNSVTNYVDHERTSRGNNRAESATFGTGAALKEQALEVITEAANGMPARVSTVYQPKAGKSLLDQIAEEGRIGSR